MNDIADKELTLQHVLEHAQKKGQACRMVFNPTATVYCGLEVLAKRVGTQLRPPPPRDDFAFHQELKAEQAANAGKPLRPVGDLVERMRKHGLQYFACSIVPGWCGIIAIDPDLSARLKHVAEAVRNDYGLDE